MVVSPHRRGCAQPSWKLVLKLVGLAAILIPNITLLRDAALPSADVLQRPRQLGDAEDAAAAVEKAKGNATMMTQHVLYLKDLCQKAKQKLKSDETSWEDRLWKGEIDSDSLGDIESAGVLQMVNVDKDAVREICSAMDTALWHAHSYEIGGKIYTEEMIRERRQFFTKAWAAAAGIEIALATMAWLNVRYSLCLPCSGMSGSAQDRCGIVLNFFTVIMWMLWILLAVFTPLSAYAHDLVNCSFGYIWEVHSVIVGFICVYRNLELILYMYEQKTISYVTFMSKFCLSCLTLIDGYTDNTFIMIAYVCGSTLWIPAFVLYLGGVLFLQYMFAPVMTVSEGGGAPGAKSRTWLNSFTFAAVHMEVMATVCMLGEDADRYTLVSESKTEEQKKEEAEKLKEQQQLQTVADVARCLSEDVLQGIIQLLFVFFNKWSTFVVFSVVLAMCLSSGKGIHGMYMAFKNG